MDIEQIKDIVSKGETQEVEAYYAGLYILMFPLAQILERDTAFIPQIS